MSEQAALLPRGWVGFLVSAMICIALGCAKSESTEPANEGGSTTQAPTQQDQVAGSISPDVLSGIWLGGATLDEAKFQQKLERLVPEQRDVVVAKAKSFLSTVIAIEFRRDGTVENDMEIISVDGQVMRDGSQGSWKVIQSKSDGLVVETQERLTDGSIAADQVFYHFFEDGNRFALAVPVSEDLQGCNAMLVFERQILSSNNLADGGSGTQTK
jgi:hypothetical protein